MCWATQPPQVPNQGQIGFARSDETSSVSMMTACLPSDLMSTRSPGRAPGTIAQLAVSPCPCASSATIETSSSGSAMARGDQKFPRPGAAEDGRRHETDHRPALGFDRGAHAVACALERRFACHPALDEIGAVKLELRLDQAHKPRSLRCELEYMRQHKTLRNEAHVDDDRVRVFTDHLSCERARIDAFKRTDARVHREAGIELSVADIDGDHLRRAVREQHVGEASGRGADVEADVALRIECEGVERGGKLDPA